LLTRLKQKWPGKAPHGTKSLEVWRFEDMKKEKVLIP
jgi:hypothetical protein